MMAFETSVSIIKNSILSCTLRSMFSMPCWPLSVSISAPLRAEKNLEIFPRQFLASCFVCFDLRTTLFQSWPQGSAFSIFFMIKNCIRFKMTVTMGPSTIFGLDMDRWKYLVSPNSVTRLRDLLHFGQLFKACGGNYFAQITHIFRQFCKGVKIFHFSSGIIFGNFFSHWVNFYWSHCPQILTFLDSNHSLNVFQIIYWQPCNVEQRKE